MEKIEIGKTNLKISRDVILIDNVSLFQAAVKPLRVEPTLNILVLVVFTIAQTLFYVGYSVVEQEYFAYAIRYQTTSGFFLLLGLLIFTFQDQIQLKSVPGGIAVVVLAVLSSFAAGVVYSIFLAISWEYSEFIIDVFAWPPYWRYVVSPSKILSRYGDH